LPIISYIIISVTAFGIGILASMLGVGGGFLLVPALMLLGLSAHNAVGTTLASIMFTGLSSFIEYSKQGRVDWKVALLLEASTAPASVFGSYLTIFVSSKGLEFLFGIMLILISIFLNRNIGNASLFGGLNSKRFIWSRTTIDREGKRFVYKLNLLPALLLAFIAGVSVGFFGISGGILKVPILMMCGIPIHVAIATSSLMITVTSTSAFFSHALLGDVEYQYLFFTVPGVILGAQIGARISKKLPSKVLRRMFSLILVVVAFMVLMDSLGLV